MQFATEVLNVPCLCRVLGTPQTVEAFDFQLLSRISFNRLRHLEDATRQVDIEALFQEYLFLKATAGE